MPLNYVEPQDIRYDDSDAKYNEDSLNLAVEQEGAIWDDYAIESSYHKNYHRYCLGTTAPKQQERVLGTAPPALRATLGSNIGSNREPQYTSAFVQLCEPTLIWRVDWTAARFNSKPFIPSTNVGSESLWVLLDETIITGTITLASDGITPRYRISGTYVFGHAAPDEKIQKNMEFSVPPWVSTNTFSRTVDDNMFKNDIIHKSAR